MKNKILASAALLGAMALAATGCAGSSGGDGGGGDEVVTVGFAQTGSESGWRSANTESMKAAFSEENGFDLIFNAADNDAAAQIAAVRDFISRGVDAIVIAPIVEDGWDDVLQEASDAGIPVVLEDRTVTASDDLFASWVGLDFKKEGVMAGEWAAETFGDTPTKMVVLEGTTGSAPANDRAEGFDEAIAGTGIETIDSQTGDFTRDGGKTVMEGFLQKYGVDGIDLLYAHNDDMALGAIEAIEAAGGVPGEDIQIVSIDAVKDGMQALVDGKINFIVECNPMLGELAAGLVTDVLAGDEVEKQVYVEDQSFDQEAAAAVIDSRPY
ncbi:simple sugar transport system substrate-binding protein [Microbacterium terrae]|uniref:ABC transporter periplasmic-binding protein YtfQ n=2 Tax=Microbacterium terrae TaxID=69369 RepID=A0A0M2GXL9_9MICO|nr:ABC transporter substrate-binding protein [Microbacterium terrae]KJL38709.1 ABC transporter periplasmic-binding protein YtfQ precursor [Microbacterium terrae]MBP1076128.1 simple sugar transport system substrate-binding protein [Microbacterium terrae]GLJ96948.1 LacI family transcriptional regulator [Microbacterium terrae]